MALRGFITALKQAFTQVFRNRAMTIASLFSITAMLLILGLFFILLVNINMITESAKQQFDTIQVYLLDDTSRDQANEMADELEASDAVKSVTYLSKEEALDEYKVKWGDNSYLLEDLPENPLPNSLRIKVERLEDADSVVEKVKTFSGIEDVRYYQTTVEKLLRITNFIQWGALVLIVFLVVVSIVVVSNTIKLTVLAREREIGIMKYVGATNWFIRGPFLAEGMIIGLISAALSVGLVSLIYYKLTEAVGQEAFVIFSTTLVDEKFLIGNLVWIFVALGVCIGAFGSILSMRRFLDT